MTYTAEPEVSRIGCCCNSAYYEPVSSRHIIDFFRLCFMQIKRPLIHSFYLIDWSLKEIRRYYGNDYNHLCTRHELAINRCTNLVRQKNRRVHIEYDRIISRILANYTSELPFPKCKKKQKHGSVIKLCRQCAKITGTTIFNWQ